MKSFLILSVVTATLALATASAQAQPEKTTTTPTTTTTVAVPHDTHTGFTLIPAAAGAAIGAGIAVFGAAKGIGNIGSAAAESTARQPEAAGAIRTAMILSAALIEGVALFGVVVCLLAVG